VYKFVFVYVNFNFIFYYILYFFHFTSSVLSELDIIILLNQLVMCLTPMLVGSSFVTETLHTAYITFSFYFCCVLCVRFI